jgi:hypothetical protein
MSNQVKKLPDLTRRARNNLNPADLTVTRLINPIVYVVLKTRQFLRRFFWQFLRESEKTRFRCQAIDLDSPAVFFRFWSISPFFYPTASQQHLLENKITLYFLLLSIVMPYLRESV